MIEHLFKTLDKVTLAEGKTFNNLTVFPLVADENPLPVYLSLKSALAQNLISITEVSEGGSVPNLKVNNQAELPVLLVDGEELVGARQNRIVNTSILLEAQKETIIPVSCTESGRWSYNSRHFNDSGVVMASKSRNSKNMRLSFSLKNDMGYDAQQSQVWNDIEQLHSKYRTQSASRAMQDTFTSQEEEMKNYLAEFPIVEGQVGLVVYLNDKLVGFDYVSRNEVYADLHEKLLKSQIIDSLYENTKIVDIANLKFEAILLLKSIAEASANQHQPVGLGVDYRLESNAVGGAALSYDDTIIHLNVFEPVKIGKEIGRDLDDKKAETITTATIVSKKKDEPKLRQSSDVMAWLQKKENSKIGKNANPVFQY